MDISRWGLSKILTLPDGMLGARFPVGLHVLTEAGQIGWDISEIALPEKGVIWEVVFWSKPTAASLDGVRFALGDQLPASNAAMMLLEPALPSVGANGQEPRLIHPTYLATHYIHGLKRPFEAKGRRLVMEVDPAGGQVADITAVFTISSIPREIPDCLFSV